MAASNLAVRVAALEKEFVTLEQELMRLKEGLANGKNVVDELPWWEKRWGMFDNDPDYDKAMALGRKYRESLRPKASRGKTRKKAAKKRVKTGSH